MTRLPAPMYAEVQLKHAAAQEGRRARNAFVADVVGKTPHCVLDAP